MRVGWTALALVFGAVTGPAAAAVQAPPMLDIARQCEAGSRHSASAMSECVVAESEARAEILQNWAKYPDSDADRCAKAGRKAKRYPYDAMLKCLGGPAAPTTAAAAVNRR